MHQVKSWAGAVAVGLSWMPVVILFRSKVASLHRVEGASMSPTLNPPSGAYSDVVLCTKLGYTGERGDVVIAQSPSRPGELVVKRVLGLPGDAVQLRSPMLREGTDPLVLEEGLCWLEGDNEASSRDSNDYGPVPMPLIEGRVAAVVWPPGRMRVLTPQSAHPRVSVQPEHGHHVAACCDVAVTE